MGKQGDLTKGNIGKTLVFFSLPMIAGNILQQMYNVADTVIVGHTIGEEALSAVGSSYSLMVFLTSIIIGLTMGSGAVFAQLIGGGNIKDFKRGMVNSFVFMFIISLIINVVSLFLVDELIVWLNIPTEVVSYAKIYMTIVLYGIIPIYITNYFSAVLRSVGNSMVSLIFIGLSAITNIVLDLVFILKFDMGVGGAAWATVTSQILSAVGTTIYFIVKFKNLMPTKKDFVYAPNLLSYIISNSVLTSVQQSIMNFGILMIQGLVNSFGLVISAAFAIVVKIDAIAYFPAQDFSNAFSIFVSQNFGAKKYDRINTGFRQALIIASVFCLLASVFVNVFAKQLIGFFIDTSVHTGVMDAGIQYLRIEGAFYVGIGILFLLYGIYRGLAKPAMSVVLTIISLGTRVVLAYMLSAIPSIGVIGIWWAIPIGWFLADLFGLVYYKKKMVKKLQLSFLITKKIM
ncbi:MAG: MATE family efflux transporter [Bacillota bacterium]|jgi:putative MATE family efflux protein|nr:MATE family efflux transporter [Bacillota bacterium]